MLRAVSYLLTIAACVVALACGHESSTPALPVAQPPSTAVLTPLAPPSAQPFAEPTVTTTAPRAPGDACVEVDSARDGAHITLEGRVFVDNAFEHPARGKTRPFILRLDEPRCAIGLESDTRDTRDLRVTEVQLAPGEDIALKPLVGRHVRVSGNPFAAHTAWHARPVVLMTTTVIRSP